MGYIIKKNNQFFPNTSVYRTKERAKKVGKQIMKSRVKAGLSRNTNFKVVKVKQKNMRNYLKKK